MDNLKKKLLVTLDGLPEHRCAEVLDFADFLRLRERDAQAAGAQPSNPEEDPLLEYAGGVAHGALAHNIDGELYGT